MARYEITQLHRGPIEGEEHSHGQWIQNSRTIRGVLQLIAHTLLYSLITFMIDDRVATPSLPKRLGKKRSSWFEGLLITTILTTGLARVTLTAWSYHAFYGRRISLKEYQDYLVAAKAIGVVWVVVTGVFALNIPLRMVNHLSKLRRISLSDPVSNIYTFIFLC